LDVSGFVVAQDTSTAGFGLLNAAYFAAYCSRAGESRSRRLGAAALVVASAAAAVEAVFSQALFWSERDVIASLSTGEWALLRLPLFAATLFISLIIVRRLRS
jgi:hypothetical protein